jgi:hypothetical protein
VASQKDRIFEAGQWRRWTKYTRRDGYIMHADGARLLSYDPWELWLATRPIGRSYQEKRTPYQELLDVFRGLRYREPPIYYQCEKCSLTTDDLTTRERVDVVCAHCGGKKMRERQLTPAATSLSLPLTEESEQSILDWCGKYGPLGIALHRVMEVTLAPQGDSQVQYIRIGAGWISLEQSITNPLTRPQPASAVVQNLEGLGVRTEPIHETWGRFFPSVPPDWRATFAYPLPLTREFWQVYAEPLEDFLDGARALNSLVTAVSSAVRGNRRLRALHETVTAGGLPTVVNALTAPTTLAFQEVKGRFRERRVGHSLLASMAVMLLGDLAHGRPVQCPCGLVFIAAAYQARYHSRRCQWRFEKRRKRGGGKKKNAPVTA